jgi:hypothetical protein
MSGPVGQIGFTNLTSSTAIPARAGPGWALSHSRAGPTDRGDVAELARIARRGQDALLAPGECNHYGIMQSRRFGNRGKIGLFVVAVERVQVNSRGHHLPTGQPPQPFLASLRQVGQAAAAFA